MDSTYGGQTGTGDVNHARANSIALRHARQWYSAFGRVRLRQSAIW